MGELTNELEKKDDAIAKLEQAAYNLGQKKIEAHLKSQITTICWGFCLRTWIKALNATGVDQSSELKDLEKVFYPLAIKVKTTAFVHSNTPPST